MIVQNNLAFDWKNYTRKLDGRNWLRKKQSTSAKRRIQTLKIDIIVYFIAINTFSKLQTLLNGWKKKRLSISQRVSATAVRNICDQLSKVFSMNQDFLIYLRLVYKLAMIIGMFWGGMIGTFWEKRWSLKWGARGSKDDQRRHGRRKWRRRARVLVCRKRTPWIKRDGEWELERLLLG